MQAHAPDEMTYYQLPDLLPDGQTLALHPRLGTLSLIVNGVPLPRLVAEQQFTASELSLLVPLLDSYPHFCLYEVLYASFYNGTANDATIAQSLTILERAKQEDEARKARVGVARKHGSAWEKTMRPLYNVIARIRSKLWVFGVDIKVIDGTGYCLLPRPASKKSDSSLPETQ